MLPRVMGPRSFILWGLRSTRWGMIVRMAGDSADAARAMGYSVDVVRLAVRVLHGEPVPEDGIPPWQTATARVTHWLLYLLLFVIPILGWLNASWRGMPIVMFGLELPALMAKRAPGWGWTGDVHGLLANYVMLVLVGLHVAAALYHHFVRRDGVLQRMLPGA